MTNVTNLQTLAVKNTTIQLLIRLFRNILVENWV